MAKSVVRSFTYAKADGTVAKRTVFVMAESSDYIRGLDFSYLSEDEQKKVQSALADHEISGVVTFGDLVDGLNGIHKLLDEIVGVLL